LTDPPATHVAYASFGARLRALVVDLAVILSSLIVIVVGGELARAVPGSGRGVVALLLGVTFLYEPILVWRYGGTIGHRTANVRIVSDTSGGNPGFGRAFARFLIKSVLGIASFVAMALTRRHQAVHDSLTRTTVQIRDLQRARPTDFAFERTLDPTVQLPGRPRRSVVILAYLLGAFVVMAIVMATVLPDACLDDIACTPGETLASDLIAISWVAASIVIIIAGWRGRLWGARATTADLGGTAMSPTVRRLAERLGTMPPHHLGGLYVAALTLTALVQHFVPVLWLPLTALEVGAFAVLFSAAAFLRHDEDVILAGFLVSFAVGIAILFSSAVVSIVTDRSVGAVALSAPARAVGLLLRGLIVVPMMSLLIWIARRVQRGLRTPPSRTVSRPAPPRREV
jgi:uncharacterized RDD family membrane protein YckC